MLQEREILTPMLVSRKSNPFCCPICFADSMDDGSDGYTLLLLLVFFSALPSFFCGIVVATLLNRKFAMRWHPSTPEGPQPLPPSGATATENEMPEPKKPIAIQKRSGKFCFENLVFVTAKGQGEVVHLNPTCCNMKSPLELRLCKRCWG